MCVIIFPLVFRRNHPCSGDGLLRDLGCRTPAASFSRRVSPPFGVDVRCTPPGETSTPYPGIYRQNRTHMRNHRNRHRSVSARSLQHSGSHPDYPGVVSNAWVAGQERNDQARRLLGLAVVRSDAPADLPGRVSSALVTSIRRAGCRSREIIASSRESARFAGFDTLMPLLLLHAPRLLEPPTRKGPATGYLAGPDPRPLSQGKHIDPGW